MPSFLLRIAIAGLLFLGHGLPKMSLYLLKKPLWGPHTILGPVNVGNWVVALIEFFCSACIIAGFYSRINSVILALMLGITAFASGLPFFMKIIPGGAQGYPLAIIPSKELQLYVALSFAALALLGPGIFSVNDR